MINTTELIKLLNKTYVERPEFKIYCNPKTWGAIFGEAEKPNNVILSHILPEGKVYSTEHDADMTYQYKPYTHFKYSKELGQQLGDNIPITLPHIHA